MLAYAAVPEPCQAALGAGDWVKPVLALLGGKGGGRPATAQGQGGDVGKLPEALLAAEQLAALKL